MSRFQPTPSQLALGALSEGEFRRALKAGFDPNALPVTQQTFADRIFGEDETFLKRTFNVVTDPLVLAGMLLHFKFPIPNTKDFFRFGEKVAGVGREFIPGTPRFLPFLNKFRGWPVLDDFVEMLRLKTLKNEQFAEEAGAAIGKWTTATGRDFGLRDQIRIALSKGGFDKTGNRMWANFRGDRAAPALARKIDLAPADRTLIADLRKLDDRMWEEVIQQAKKQGKESELIRTARAQGVVDELDDIKKLPDYFPFIQVRGARTPEQMLDDLIRSAPTQAEAAKRATQAAAESVLAPAARQKTFAMLPSVQDLEQVEDLLQPGALNFVKTRLASNPDIRTFSLRTVPVLATHGHTMSRMFAWTTSGLGSKIRNEAVRMETMGPNGRILAHSLNNTYIPLALGRKTQADINRALEWGNVMNNSLEMMNDLSKQPGLVGKLGTKMRDVLLRNTSVQPGTEAAAYFFHSTLGLNPASAVLNLSQSVATIGLVGPTAWAEAASRVSKKFSPLLGTLDDVKIRKVLEREFPDFIQSGLDPNPFIKELMVAGREFSRNASAPTSARKVLNQAKEVSLFMFQRSELFNRLAAFEAGLVKAARDGVRSPIARRDFARQLTEVTQFAGDRLLSTPEFLLNVPPVFRQFAQFPLRAGELLVSTAPAIGSAAQAIPGNVPFVSGRNLGTVGRFMLAMGLLSEGGRQFLGTDLSRFSFSDALPTPREFGPFAPFPIVPPALGLVGSLASDYVNETGFEQTRRFGLPLLVPGGTALSRLSEAGLPGTRPAARFLGRNFADYNAPAEDGRVQIFDKEGRTVAQLTPMQIWMRSMGLPVGDLQAAQELQARIRRNREVTLKARADYIGAVLDNDYAKARRLQERFEADFDTPLQVRQADLTRARQKRENSRLQRQVGRLPREIRSQFQEALRVLEAQTTANFLNGGGSPEFVDGVPPANPTDPTQSKLGGLGGLQGGGTGNRFSAPGGGPPQSRPIDIGTLFGGSSPVSR